MLFGLDIIAAHVLFAYALIRFALRAHARSVARKTARREARARLHAQARLARDRSDVIRLNS